MVCVWVAGGSLNEFFDLASQLAEAARHHSLGDAAAAIALYRAILNQSPRQPDDFEHSFGSDVLSATGGAPVCIRIRMR